MMCNYIRKIDPGRGYFGIRVYHTIDTDGATAKCGRVSANDTNFEIVESKTRILPSMMCANCLNTGVRRK
jgi:hypothetical protein